MSKKQSENISRRQSRKEELRKKERQQQMIVIGAVALIAIVFVAIFLISTQKAANNAAGGPINKITLKEYKNANGTSIGDPNAKIKIDVFEDYQCVHCRDYTENVEPQVIAQLVDTGRVYYVFHQHPFLDDPNSTDQGSHRAALASECAAEQNDFWNYKSILFANYTGVAGEFSDERLKTFAKLINLNTSEFNTCLAEAKYQSKLDEGLNLGVKMGVKGTPSIFVNDVSVLPDFNDILQAVLKAEQGG
jgi:protein-disulfide isomerase